MSPHDRLDTDPHRRAQRALAERHAGILETTESAWLDSHLAGCDECRAVAQSLAETTRATGGGRGHLPSRLISRWATESQTMPDVVRGYAIRHLRDCEQCREAFRIVGQPLPIEVASAARERVVIAARPGLVRRWFRDSRAGYWVAGAGLAAAAALVVVFVSMQRTSGMATNTPPDVQPPSVRDSTIAPTPTPQGPGPSTQQRETVPALALAGGDDDDVRGTDMLSLDQATVRGGGAAPDSSRVFTVSSHARALRLAHPEAALLAGSESDSVAIAITMPSGMKLTCAARIGDLRIDRPLVLRIPKGIEPGRYRYEYQFSTHGEPPLRGEIRVELR
ncbi:MAG TPA: hypothetical protein VN896_02995 [Methylomirabilota bacterium]|nr:hypothetical protein [Methylomirabilota bacterium]